MSWTNISWHASLRLYVDYRKLNKLTIRYKYPLPLMDQLCDCIPQVKVFTKPDLKDGYHDIGMTKDDAHKTAFRTR